MITLNGSSVPWTEGLTVSKLLEREKMSFRMIAVWIDDSAVEKGRYESFLIPDGADVQVIHNISGG